MTLTQLKTRAAELGITADDARQYGKLSAKATWQAAIDKMSEAIALAADATAEAQPPAETTAEAVTSAVYSQQSRDAFYWICYAVVLTVFATFLLAAKVAQLTWQASAPLRHRASGRIHSEWWAAVGAWPDLLMGL